MFQKSYTGNILGIGRKKAEPPIFLEHESESKAETEGGPGPGHTLGRRGPCPGRATRG
jgi:hypothetical protein